MKKNRMIANVLIVLALPLGVYGLMYSMRSDNSFDGKERKDKIVRQTSVDKEIASKDENIDQESTPKEVRPDGTDQSKILIWTDPEVIITGNKVMDEVNIKINNEKIYISYLKQHGAGYDLFLTSNENGNWETEKITNDEIYETNSSLAISDGKIYVAYLKGNNKYDACVSSRKINEKSWALINLTKDNSATSFIGVEEHSGFVYVVFNKISGNGSQNCFMASNTSGKWLTSKISDLLAEDLAIDIGQIHVLLVDDNEKRYILSKGEAEKIKRIDQELIGPAKLKVQNKTYYVSAFKPASNGKPVSSLLRLQGSKWVDVDPSKRLEQVHLSDFAISDESIHVAGLKKDDKQSGVAKTSGMLSVQLVYLASENSWKLNKINNDSGDYNNLKLTTTGSGAHLAYLSDEKTKLIYQHQLDEMLND